MITLNKKSSAYYPTQIGKIPTIACWSIWMWTTVFSRKNRRIKRLSRKSSSWPQRPGYGTNPLWIRRKRRKLKRTRTTTLRPRIWLKNLKLIQKKPISHAQNSPKGQLAKRSQWMFRHQVCIKRFSPMRAVTRFNYKKKSTFKTNRQYKTKFKTKTKTKFKTKTKT